jgi:hypothetical protein
MRQGNAVRNPRPLRAAAPDQRAAVRRETELEARIRIADLPWIACTVRNISPIGALLEFAAPTILPPLFRLQIPGDRFEAECSLRHQSGIMAGVFFISNRGGATARYA